MSFISRAKAPAIKAEQAAEKVATKLFASVGGDSSEIGNLISISNVFIYGC